jgi:hypothetical protein
MSLKKERADPGQGRFRNPVPLTIPILGKQELHVSRDAGSDSFGSGLIGAASAKVNQT